jgi:hypothetical protein
MVLASRERGKSTAQKSRGFDGKWLAVLPQVALSPNQDDGEGNRQRDDERQKGRQHLQEKSIEIAEGRSETVSWHNPLDTVF